MNRVQLCKKDNCIKAEGRSADAITTAAVVMLLLFGIAAIIKAAN